MSTPILSAEGKNVSITVTYGINGMVDCKKAIEVWTEFFEEKLGMKLKGSIDPGDSACGLEWETPSPQHAKELKGFIESRFGDFENYRTAREIFPLPGNIIKVSLPIRDSDEIRSGSTSVKPNGIQVGTWGEDRLEATLVEIDPQEINDYQNGIVIFSEKEDEAEYKSHVTALLIPQSRVEDITYRDVGLSVKPLDLLKLGKRTFPIGVPVEISSEPLPAHIIPEQEVGEAEPKFPLERLFESDQTPVYTHAVRIPLSKENPDEWDQYMIDTTGKLYHVDSDDLSDINEIPLDEAIVKKTKEGSTPKLVQLANIAFAAKPKVDEKKDPVVDDVIKYFNAVLGHKRLPKEEWKSVEAAVKPFLATPGGLKKDAFQAIRSNPTAVKLCREHVASKKGPEMA